MSQKTVRVGLTGFVLTLAFAGLLWTTLGEGMEYYKHVHEVMAEPDEWYGKRLQLHGFVVHDSIMRRRDSLDYRFHVEKEGAVVPAYYTGIVPDTFTDGAEVVLKGSLGPDGFHVDPNGVMAKCPSKYDPAQGPVSPGAATPGGAPAVPSGY